MYRPLVAALCLAGLALAGCGGSQPAIPQGSSRAALPGSGGPAPADASLAGLNACALVPPATVHQVYGGLAQPCTGAGIVGDIRLVSATDPNHSRASVTMSVFKRSSFDGARTAARDGVTKDRTFASVPGIGDSAYSVTVTDQGAGVWAYGLVAARGGLALGIRIDSFEPLKPSDAQAVRQLMTVALSRL
jgi:hypothetical protein